MFSLILLYNNIKVKCLYFQAIKQRLVEKMCDKSDLHVSSSLNSCRLPTPCFNCGVYSPHHLTLTRTILNSLSQLYNTHPQCSSCGLRTPDIAKHLDWHFRLVFLHYIFPQPHCILFKGATESLKKLVAEIGIQVTKNGVKVTAAPTHMLPLPPKMFIM